MKDRTPTPCGEAIGSDVSSGNLFNPEIRKQIQELADETRSRAVVNTERVQSLNTRLDGIASAARARRSRPK